LELLAPAGGWDALVAAIENGADAVYIGGKDFSARHSADNFDREEIKRALDYAHMREQKIYVAVNTLIDNTEFNQALDYVYELYRLSVDAVIVQDLGLLFALKKIMPALPLHASTQMTIHNQAGVKFLEELGVKRVVLAREVSGEEIRQIKQSVPGMELEVFVHGALCFSYSGQCLFSSMVGGRSGNRGRCAQACRLSYDLYSGKDNSGPRQGDRGRYMLSPSDLCLIDYLPQLEDMGVSSLKIEGRMKRPEYVAVVTRSYRKVLDTLENNKGMEDLDELKREMLQVFNRNFSPGYFLDQRHDFLSSKRPNNRGVYVGRVLEQEGNGKTRIKLSDHLNSGDGIEIWVARGKGPVLYAREIRVNGQKVNSAERGDTVEVEIEGQVAPGDRVFKIFDAQLLESVKHTVREYSSGEIKLYAEVLLTRDQPIKITFQDEKGTRVEVRSQSPACPAQKHGLDESVLREKLGRLGNTPFTLGDLKLTCSEPLMIPISELNEARRRAVEQFMTSYLESYQYPPIDPKNRIRFTKEYGATAGAKKRVSLTHSPLLSVMVSGANEARAAIDAGANRVYIGLEGVGQARPVSIKVLNQLVQEAREKNCEIVPALPRIQKPGEEKEWEGLLELSCGSIMVGNVGSLQWGREHNLKVRADYSLNVFNNIMLNYLLNLGLESVCLSPELNFQQLREITPMAKSEVLVQGELILMLSQFCTLRAMLGKEEGKCPAYCRQAQHYIRDDKGYEFPLAGDSNCRFYVFNSRTLCLIDDLDKVIDMGIGSIRIEARRQSEDEIRQMVAIYRRTLNQLQAGEKPDYENLKVQLARVSPSKFTKCHYYRGVL
jgi:putative protease